MKVILLPKSLRVVWSRSKLHRKGNLIKEGGEDAALTAGETPALLLRAAGSGPHMKGKGPRDAGATVAGRWRWDLGAIESSKMTVF